MGAVNFYHDMWPKRSHILDTLTSLTGTKFEWKPEHQQAFERMKKLMATDILIAYTNHNKPFHIYTDASNFQLGAAIFQDGKPVMHYTRELDSAQKNYMTIKKDLLSMVETLSKFHSMLLGSDLHIHTNHKNLTQFHFSSQRVLRWQLFLKEFSFKFHYIPGHENFLAYFLSINPLLEGNCDNLIEPSQNTTTVDTMNTFFDLDPFTGREFFLD